VQVDIDQREGGDSARQMLDTHELRAADALQLSAALVWCQQRPTSRNFLCSDRWLIESAKAQGFSVIAL
jgi:hypothetical protein